MIVVIDWNGVGTLPEIRRTETVSGSALQLIGAYGYSKEFTMEQRLRDAWGWGEAAPVLEPLGVGNFRLRCVRSGGRIRQMLPSLAHYGDGSRDRRSAQLRRYVGQQLEVAKAGKGELLTSQLPEVRGYCARYRLKSLSLIAPVLLALCCNIGFGCEQSIKRIHDRGCPILNPSSCGIVAVASMRRFFEWANGTKKVKTG